MPAKIGAGPDAYLYTLSADKGTQKASVGDPVIGTTPARCWQPVTP